MFCTEKKRKTCNVEKMGCEGCFYNLEGPMEEYLKCYDELKRNKHIFKTIEPDFFFKFTEYLINKNKQLEFLYSDCCKCLLNSIPKSKVKEKIEELDKEEQELQNTISDEEREEYSDASISWELCDIETRRRCYKELLEK